MVVVVSTGADVLADELRLQPVSILSSGSTRFGDEFPSEHM